MTSSIAAGTKNTLHRTLKPNKEIVLLLQMNIPEVSYSKNT